MRPIRRMRLLPLLGLVVACGAGSSPQNAPGGDEPASATEPAAAAPAEAPPAAAPPADPPLADGPHLEFFELSHDFGVVSDTEVLSHAFDFLNTGNAELRIGEIDTSCGCTTPGLAKREYAPNDGAFIEVTWDTKGLGPQRETDDITSNTTPSEVIRLTVSATVEPFLRMTPTGAVFGAVRRGEPHERRVSFVCQSKELIVERVWTQTPHVNAHLTAPVVDGRGQLLVSLGQQVPWGVFVNKVFIEARADANSPNCTTELRVSATLHDELVYDVPYVAVGRVPLSKPFRKEVVVRHALGAPFFVIDARVINATISGLSAMAEPIGNEAWRIVVTGMGPSVETTLSGARVRVTTDVPGDQQRDLPIYGIVGPPVK